MKTTENFSFHKTTPKRLSLAVRSVLLGAVILPTLPLHAELVVQQQFSALDSEAVLQNTLEQPLNTAQETAADLPNQADSSEQNVADADALADSDPLENLANVAQAAQTQAVSDVQSDGELHSQASKAQAKPSSRLFKNSEAQSRSLAKLSEHYHAKPSETARCQGVWVQPARSTVGASHGEIFAAADYGYWDADEYAELSGNVVVEQDGRQVLADKLTFNPKTGEGLAHGQVQFSDGDAGDADKGIGAGIIGVADELAYSTDGSSAHARDVAFASTTINAHGYAGSLEKLSNSQYQMNEVMFSTCPPTERKWHLDAAKIDIDSDTGRAIARNATLRIKDVPVLYLPYFNFPIDNRRASGFLLPTAGFSTGSLEVSAPYYLNLAPNYDATITPTIFSNKNPMLTGEFRYLTENYGAGTLNGSYLPSDRTYGNQNRSRVRFDHEWQSPKVDHLTAYAQYQYVSDADYLRDFDSLGLETRALNLPRRIGAKFFNEYIDADLRFESFQRLGSVNYDGTPITDKDRPYARLPQLSVSYRVPSSKLGSLAAMDNLQISGVHHSAYFKKSIRDGSELEKSGARMYNQISASYPVLRPWGYITPKLSLTHLYASYDEDSQAAQNLSEKEGTYSVFAPQVSIDTGLFFEKAGSPFGLYDDTLGGYQVLTPRLKYNYTPFKNQANIPNFDTSIAHISYDQLLSDSWFLGFDRIQDLHAITPALSYRYIDNQGRTRFDGGIAEQILLDDLRVGIDDSERFSGKSSGMAWQASIQPRDNLWIDTAGAFTTDYHLNSFGAQIRYQPDEQRLFNLGIIDRKEHKATNQQALSAYTASVIFPVSNRWRLLGQAQYDYKHNRLLDSLVGINYEDCCYGLSIYARRYRDIYNPQQTADTAVMAEIRLNGITSSGKLNRLLSDKITGYDGVQRAWQQAY